MDAAGTSAALRRRSGGPLALLFAALLASGCTQGYVSDPWAGHAPGWKREHFATHAPDAVLDQRAAHTQSDR
jgi:hypothetical protein